MPIFNFKCTECNHEGEKLISFDESVKLQECPSCHKQSYKKEMSYSTHVPILKGSGFYATDFKGK